MQKVTLLFTFLITLALSTVIIVFFEDERTNTLIEPRELYQVYLAGEKIGVIESKKKLEEYIDKKQEEIKTKYNVGNVYPPKNLNIQEYISYGEKVLTEEEVYNKINEVSPFTVKGKIIRIKASTEGEQDKIVNVLSIELFNKAAKKVVEHFVDHDDLQLYVDETQPEIKETGKIIENVSQSSLFERDAYISVNETIFTDENELSKYLLFGTTNEQKKYVVKDGDTIEQIAFNNQLGTEEFLVANPEFSNSNSLLFPGQEVSVGLIDPTIDITVVEHIVEDQPVKFDTETVYDDTLAYGTTKVKQEGVDGTFRVVEKRRTINGVIEDVQIDRLASTILKEPINKIIVKGTKKNDGGTAIISPDGKWVWPTNAPYVITTYYGYRWGQMHAAIDVSGTGYGSPIRAARAGTVLTSGSDKTRGNYLVLVHDSNYYTIYLHLAKKYASLGQSVAAGQVIATMGNTGFVVGVTGTHLHFAVHIGEPYKAGTLTVNPLTLYR